MSWLASCKNYTLFSDWGQGGCAGSAVDGKHLRCVNGGWWMASTFGAWMVDSGWQAPSVREWWNRASGTVDGEWFEEWKEVMGDE